MSIDYSDIVRLLLQDKQDQAAVWYQLRAAGLALVKAAEQMGGPAARDLGTGPIVLHVPCPRCKSILHIQRGVTDIGGFTKTCTCGYELVVK
jgi:hypothetical protein